MARQPEVIERFRISAETSMEKMGGILAVLTRLGVENIGFELIADVPTYRQNGARQDHGSTSEQFAAEWVKDHPTFKAKLLVEHFTGAGRTGNSAYGALKNLVANGTLKALGDGNYQRADIQTLAAPAERKKRGQQKSYPTSNRQLILDFLGRRTKFSISELVAHFGEQGRPKQSATSVVSKMASDGAFRKLGDGQYEVLKKPKTNGQQEAANNG